MDGLELHIPSKSRIATNTPLETKTLREVKLMYTDGTEAILLVDDNQGFHRTNSYVNNGVGFTTHEIFIAYGKV